MSELVIPVSAEVEGRLREAAVRVGLPLEEYAANALEALAVTQPEQEALEPPDEEKEKPALMARYAAAGISWNGQRVRPRMPTVRATEGASIAQLLVDDRR